MLMPDAPLSVIGNKKCPFLAPSIRCMSTGFATVECFDRRFHQECEHRKRAESKGKATKPQKEVADSGN